MDPLLADFGFIQVTTITILTSGNRCISLVQDVRWPIRLVWLFIQAGVSLGLQTAEFYITGPAA